MKKSCYKENIKENEGLIPEFSGAARRVSSTQVVTQQQASKTLKQVQGLTNRNITGFTLIELLVVILIIGILAAIALPQYQKAVWHARAMELVTLTSTAAKARQIAYMEKGEWIMNFPDLDIQLPLELWTGSECPDDEGNWVPCGDYQYAGNDDIEIKLDYDKYTSGGFLTGPYRGVGFVVLHDDSALHTGATVGKIYCVDGMGSYSTGFCEKIMHGKKEFDVSALGISAYSF